MKLTVEVNEQDGMFLKEQVAEGTYRDAAFVLFRTIPGGSLLLQVTLGKAKPRTFMLETAEFVKATIEVIEKGGGA